MTDLQSRRKQDRGSIAGEASAIVILACICAFLGAGVASNYHSGKNNKEITVSVDENFAENAETYGKNEHSLALQKIEAGEKQSGESLSTSTTLVFPSEDFLFPESSQRTFTNQELMTIQDTATWQRAKMEIYARHGYDFQGQEATEECQFFSGKSWYKELKKKTEEEVMAELSGDESMNIMLLDSYYYLMGW